MSRLWQVLDRLSPWIAIGLIGIGFSVVHEQGQEIQQSRRDATLHVCEEANTHHEQAKVSLKVLFASGQRPTTAAGVHHEQHLFNVFLSAIAPRYPNCEIRAKSLTKS